MKNIYLLFICLVCAFGISAATPIAGASQFGFIENKGQVMDQNYKPNNDVLYLYNGSNMRVQLRKDGFSYELVRTQILPSAPLADPENHEAGSEFHVHRVDFSFMAANKNISITTSLPAPDYINYYTAGTPENGVVKVKHFSKVVYHDIYPNIDAEFILGDSKQNGNFKYNLVVRPGGNLNDIRLSLEGATTSSLNSDGNILIETSNGTIEETLPLSYELIQDVKREVTTRFIALDKNTYGITSSDFNSSNTLVIDPVPYTTYFGGTLDDKGLGVSVDVFGYVIMNGHTVSTSNIATTGAYQTTYGGGSNDLFVVRFTNSGMRTWATYFGGTGYDYGYGVVSDLAGNIIAAGYTNSTASVASTAAFQTTIGGGYDGYLAKFDSSGIRRWSTYLGTTAYDNCLAIGIDPFANVFVTGYAGSAALATSGAYKTTLGGTYDIHITKFDSSGVRRWGTLYGGTSDEQGRVIAGDLNGNVIGGGTTASSTGISSTGASQVTFGGGTDAFFTKFDSAGTFLWGTYCGGSGAEEGRWLATDLTGNIVFAGNTASATNIASSTGVFQATLGGSSDAFLCRFNPSGVKQWGTYYGGTSADIGYGVNTDPNGNVLLTGYAASTSGITSSGAQQSSHAGGTNDAFIAKFDSMGARLWGTYLGGSGSDFGSSVASDAAGNVYFAGYGPSTSGIIYNSALAHQSTYGGGGNDAYLAVYLSSGLLPVKLVSFDAVNEQNKVRCNWVTATETNNDYFEVQRSLLPNEKWETVTRVEGKGTTSASTSYTAMDNLADLSLLPPALYYRLKQTDFDGKFSYSVTRMVTFEKDPQEIKVYPNPSTGIVTLQNPLTTTAHIQLTDINGKLIDEAIVQPNTSMEHDYTHLATGVYFIKVSYAEKVSYSKLVISE